jgi:hypothetical protein
MTCHRCHNRIGHPDHAKAEGRHWYHPGCWNHRHHGHARTTCDCNRPIPPDTNLYSCGERVCPFCYRAHQSYIKDMEYNERLRRLVAEIGRYIDPYTVAEPARNYL